MIKHRRTYLFLAIIILIILWGSAGYYFYKNKDKTTATSGATQIITVQTTTPTQTMYYNGTIRALSMMPVTSPSDGIVQSMNFNYGDTITKGQLLLSLSSSNAQTNFQTALTAYLQAKSQEETSRAAAESDILLYQQGVISRNEYESAQSTHYFNHLNMLQAGAALTRLNYDTSNILNLSLDNLDAVKKAFDLTKGTQYLKIYSPQDGVALFASQSSSSSDSSQTINVGSSVKQDQVLLNIGDLSGASLTIKIDQININNIKAGQAATVTGAAFPNITLKGTISTVATQASTSNDNPQFEATVVISNLTANDLETIRVGMTATVAVVVTGSPQLMVPINAVTAKDGKYYVTKVAPNRKQTQVEVTTGSTNATSVAITSGLAAGDQIVAPHSTT
ncbi:MAG: hypothetical protein A3C55_00795 [Gammaproteobacteria bacterium RIFCSPHIGHO2_02_FULL_42_13]|nr:MAG: hypothetical protein A3C55_00795 [Gammaproteobacteria bacterium RIFCSPHIGHO2_02_FULL_42_13]OGT71080.1 MAG: hypothetical protein A3H43_04870 [Gammaproteobacteria bacterium RIFCSPLOWO2_02_FULL_42_9]